MRKLRHAEIARPSLNEISTIPRMPVVVVLDNIRSLYNVGSIFRTSDAFLVEKIFLTGITGTPENLALQKTALGAQDTVPWEFNPSTLAVIQSLKASGYTIASLEITDNPKQFTEIRPKHYPLCLVVGHEVFGIQDEIISSSDFALEIPQYGIKQSLNVSVAFGIAAFAISEKYHSFFPQR